MSRRTPAGESKRAPLNMRTTPEMRGKLEAAAAARGLSITQEVMRRIEESFQAEEKLDRESGRAASNFLLRLIKGAVASVEAKTSKEWKDDPRTATVCEGTIAGIVEVIVKPLPGELQPNKLMGQTEDGVRAELLEVGRQIGRVFAQDRLSDQVKKLDDGAWADS